MGTANRINAYRKTITLSAQRSNPQFNRFNKDEGLTDMVLSLNKQNKTEAAPKTTEQLNESNFQKSFQDQLKDFDLGQATYNLKETEQVVEIVQKLEKNYFEAKQQMNVSDLQSIDADVTVQTLQTCYLLVQNALAEEITRFDREKIDQKLEKIINKVKQSNIEWNTTKGEFLAVHEPIINKDILSFKVDRIQKNLERQDQIIKKLPSIQKNIKENKQTLSFLKEAYEQFEGEIFKSKYTELQSFKKKTEEIIQKINEQKITLEAKIDAAKQLIECVIPINKEQTQKLISLQLEISKIQTNTDQSLKKHKKLLSLIPDLQEKFEQVQQSLNQVIFTELQDMIPKSKNLQVLVDNLKDWKEVQTKFQELTNHNFNPIQLDSQKILDDSKNLLDQLANLKKGEFDNLIKQIQILAEKIKDEGQEQANRLQQFEKDFLNPQNSSKNQHISDQDLFFLKKEVNKDKASLITTNGLVNEVLNNSLQIKEESKNNEIIGPRQNTFTDNDLLNLRANLKVLQKQVSIDLPRVKSNVDQLENFSAKLLKNGLNDDNKKSQNQISKMKKNYEDLQKIIDTLNEKLIKNSKEVAQLKELFQNEDLDRDFQFKTKLDDVLEKCAQEINSLEPIDDMNSLQVRKKEIIGEINQLVSQFNDNNKSIKQTNKEPKNDQDVLDLVKRNQQIQKECDDLENKIKEAVEFAEEINNLLEQKLEVNFLNAQNEFENKNRLIDICDDLFDKLNTKITDDEDILNNEIEKLNQLIDKLEEISPLNQPLPNGADNQQFKQNILNYLDKARNLREELEELKGQIEILKDEMVLVVQPLNELSERPVFIKDVQNIYDKLQQLTVSLTTIDNESTPKHFQTQQILKQVEETIESGKKQKLQEIEQKYQEFDNTIDQLLIEKKNAEENQIKLNKLIDFASKDPTLMNEPENIEKIRNAENQQKLLEKDFRDIEAKIADIHKKKIDTKKVVEDIQKNSKNFSSQQLSQFISALDDQVEKAKSYLDKSVSIKVSEIKHIDDLNNLIGERQQKAQLKEDFNDIRDQVNDDIQALQQVLETLPDQINKLLATNLEMQMDSIDETCDYWEERNRIAKNIEMLQNIKPQIGAIKSDFGKYLNQFHHLQSLIKPNTGSDSISKILNELKDLQSLIVDNVNQAVYITEEAENVKSSMGDCEIPVNIQVRKNELQNFSDKLKNTIDDFLEMKSTHQQNEIDEDSGKQIEILLNNIQEKLKPIQKEEADLKQYLKKYLEAYQEQDFISYDNIVIIKEVLDFKKRIRSGLLAINQFEEMCNDLNSKMVQQDVDNAVHLLGKRTSKLKTRLLTAQEVLKKINKAGNQMDGNTTHSEEDDFIEALKEEMPEVFKNIESNQAFLESTEKNIAKISQSRDINLMASVKKQIEDLEKKVQQSESLALKLENEIIEWNAQKKLIRRDDEMNELTNICQEIKDDIKQEEDLMNTEYEKNCQKMKSEGDSSGELINMNKGIASYMIELEELKAQFNNFNQKRENLYTKMDPELPKSVIDSRNKKNSSYKILKNRKDNPQAILWDKDIYYMLGINCKYRGAIQDLLKELRSINQIRKDLDVRYAKLKNDLVNFKPKPQYKAIKGDLVDELFSKILNSVGINIPVKRLTAGKYLFGSRQIMAKIINGKLVIRVGGGYMSAEEFIEQYGAIELEKMMKAGTILEQPGQFDNQIKGIEGGAISMQEMKQIMKEQLFQVKLYTRDNVQRESVIGNPFGTKQGNQLINNEHLSLLQVEQNYEAIKFGAAVTTKARHTKLSVSPMRTSKNQHSTTPNKNQRQ